MQKFNFVKYFIIAFSFILFFFTPFNLKAATLSINPSSVNVSVKDLFSTKVIVNTLGKAINNGEAVIKFPKDLLEVVSITKPSSIFSLWVEDPTFSNTDGTITFNGGIQNPGFTGSNGSIISINFKAKKQGTASIDFVSASVRENDGLGTDILNGKNSSVIQIKQEDKTVVVPVIEVANTKSNLPDPIIISSTHPDQEKWYSLSSASFNWKIPNTATSIKTLYNKNPDSNPTITYDNSVTQKTLNDLPDRVFYFHLRYYDGGWSPVAHYKFKVDTTAPNAFSPIVKSSDNKNLVTLNASDDTSGIQNYSISIDNGELLNIENDKLVNNEYELPVLNKGDHSLALIAYDKAGNHTESKITFTNPFSTSVPEIYLSSNEILKGQDVTISGKTDYPNTQVEIVLKQNGNEISKFMQTTGADGTFSFVTEKINVIGTFEISAQNVLSETTRSEFSKDVRLDILDKDIIKLAVNKYWILISIAILIFLFIIFYLGWYKFFALRRKIRNGSIHPVDNVYNATLQLKEELDKQLEVLKKIKTDGVLNKKDEITLSQIQKKEESIMKDIQRK